MNQCCAVASWPAARRSKCAHFWCRPDGWQRESPSTQMSNQLTRRDFAIRTAGFGLAMGLTPTATLAEAEQASRSETSPAIADPYSLVDPELLPVLKQFPAFDLSAEMVRKFRQTPGMFPDRQEHPRFVFGSLILRRRRRASRCCFTCMAAAS
jgi:hypothetical protein